MALFGHFEVRAVPQAGSGVVTHRAGDAQGVPGTCISSELPPTLWSQEIGHKPCVVQKHFPPVAAQRSYRIGSAISAVATQLKYIQILVTPLDHDFPFLVTFYFFDMERSNSKV